MIVIECLKNLLQHKSQMSQISVFRNSTTAKFYILLTVHHVMIVGK